MTDVEIERPTVEQQMTINEDGELEPEAESEETDLQQWGIVEAEPERTTRVEEEAASEFGVDDRTCDQLRSSETEQETLVADVEEDQRTLGGEQAAGQSRWDR